MPEMPDQGPAAGTGLRVSTQPGRSGAQIVRLLGLRLIGRLYSRLPRAATPRSVLLIRPDHLGDVLFLTPALRNLREALPAVHITALLGPWSAHVLRDNPDVDEIHTCRFPGFERRPKSGPLAPYRYLLETARDLRGAGYDTAVVLRCDHWWGAWLAAVGGIACRLGYGWPETRPFLTQALPYEPGRHEVEQNSRLLAALAPGAQWRPGPLRFVVADADRAWAATWLAAHGADLARPLVAIHPGAGAVVKQWEPPAWAAVGEALVSRRGAQVLLTGSAGESALTGAVAAGLTGGALDAAGETSLGQLAALQERCSLVLGSDCGPLHLAVAVGAPTVQLFGPVSAITFGPWGDPQLHVVLTSRWTCVPCNRLDWPANVLREHRCMAAVEVGEVIEAAVGLLPG
jgi:ADP-heptose:LPS heptosyltransferase